MVDVPGRFSFRKRSIHDLDVIDKSEAKQVQLFSITNNQTMLLAQEIPSWLDTDSYWFPSYFKCFFNFGFLVCLIPFRITHENVSGQVNRSFPVISRNCLQKIIAALIHCVLLVLTTIIISSFLTMKLREKPSDLFCLVDGCTSAGVLVAFVYTCWRKQDACRDLLQVFQRPGKTMPWKAIGIFFAISIIPIFQYVLSNVLEAFAYQDDSKLHQALAFQLWALWLRNSQKLGENEVIADLTLKYIGYTTMAVDHLLHTLVLVSSAIVVFIGAVSVREIVSKYLTLFRSESAKTMSLQLLSDLYLRMEKQIAFVNDVTGPLTLGWFALTVSFFLKTFFQVFSAADGALKALNFVTIVYYVSVLVIAADAHNKALECESILMERGSSKYNTGKHWSPAFVGYLEMSEIDMGLRGSDFFVISYKFIGTTVGMMVTYLLVMLQFNLELESQSASSQNGTESTNTTNSSDMNS